MKFLRQKLTQKSEKLKLTKGTCKIILHDFQNIITDIGCKSFIKR